MFPSSSPQAIVVGNNPRDPLVNNLRRLFNQGFTFVVPCHEFRSLLYAITQRDVAVQTRLCQMPGNDARRFVSKHGVSSKKYLFWQGQKFRIDSIERDCLFDRIFDHMYAEDEWISIQLSAYKNVPISVRLSRTDRQFGIIKRKEIMWQIERLKQLSSWGVSV